MIVSLLIVLACAILNRMRGDDRWMREGFAEDGPKRLPGRALWYIAPIVGLVALVGQFWPIALAFSAGYLFWAVWSWGCVFAAVGGFAPDRSATGVDRILMKLPGRVLPVFARSLFVAPGVAAVAILTHDPLLWLFAPVFAGLATAVYFLLFRQLRRLDWLRAEVVIGALWGLMIVGTGQ